MLHFIVFREWKNIFPLRLQPGNIETALHSRRLAGGIGKKTKQKKITRVRPTPHFHRQEGASSPASSCLMVFYEMAPERDRETERKTIKVKLQLNQNEIDLCTFYRTRCQTWIQLLQRYEKNVSSFDAEFRYKKVNLSVCIPITFGHTCVRI